LRTFEILTALFLFLTILRYAIPNRPRWLEFLPVATLVVNLLQLLIEGYRWQMIPLYAFSTILFLISLPSLLKPNRTPANPLWRRLTWLSLGLIFLVAATALPILLPIPQIPKASGPYQVGTFSMMLTDDSRNELYSGNPSDPRRIMIQVWYPADPLPEDQAAPWMDRADLIGPAISSYLDLPVFFLDHLKYAQTGAFLNSPVSHAKTTYPVLLFSHGWNGFRAQNSYQAINFASNGFVVAAIDHTYGAVLTIFPDGQLVYNNPQALPHDIPDPLYIPIANKLANQWAGDLGFVLDTLQKMNENDPDHGLTGILDLEKVGVYGHSTGGGATVEFCGRDPRCKAGLGLDAFLKPVSKTILEVGLRQPFLFMFSDTWPSAKNWDLFNELYLNSDHAKVLSILGTSHYDFSDLPILSPLAAQMGLKGPLSGERVIKITGNYPLAFFNQVFYGFPTTLLDGLSPDYPEVVFP
jgi:predicted dienelactone hydrolase